MAKSLDEHISDAVERATQKAIAKMLKGIEKTVADIVRRSVSEAVNASEAGRMDSDRLVTKSSINRYINHLKKREG